MTRYATRTQDNDDELQQIINNQPRRFIQIQQYQIFLLLFPPLSSFFSFFFPPFSPPFPLFFPSPQHEKIAEIGNNFVLWGCLSVSIGLVHFSTHSPVDEDPAKCVYRALICLSEAVDLTIKRGAHMHGSWGTYEGIDGSSHPITRQPLPHTSPSTTR